MDDLPDMFNFKDFFEDEEGICVYTLNKNSMHQFSKDIENSGLQGEDFSDH